MTVIDCPICASGNIEHRDAHPLTMTNDEAQDWLLGLLNATSPPRDAARFGAAIRAIRAKAIADAKEWYGLDTPPATFGVPSAERDFAFPDAEAVARKVRWEGGIVGALDYGLRASDIGDPALAVAWLDMATAHEEFERLRGVVAKLLGLEDEA